MSLPRALILSPTPESIRKASEAILRGEVVGMPTETVYGLAGNAFNPAALAKIFDVKERPTFDPLIVHVGKELMSVSALESAGIVDAPKLSAAARAVTEILIRKFWPGPLTLVLPKLPGVPDLATSGLPTVAVRMPAHPVAQALLAEAKTPLAAPSANRFGRISPTKAEHVLEELGDRISLILDGGASRIGLESTVLKINEDASLMILRPGEVSATQIEEVTGKKLITTGSASTQAAMPAPGMLESHYAPGKRLLLLSKPLLSSGEDPVLGEALKLSPKKLGILLMSGSPQDEKISRLLKIQTIVRSLSHSGDLHEIAQNLFSELRALDHTDADVLVVEPCHATHGIGHAIADRLRRASAKR